MVTVKQFADQMGEELYGLHPDDAIAQGICLECRQPALKNCYSDAGRREFYISALCEKCFDKMFEE